MAESRSSDELTAPFRRSESAETGTTADPAPMDRIGRFRVREVLGHGGMGLVLSAHDPQLDRKVAIKLVKPGAGGGRVAEVKARLLREARAMARFRHPNIVSVFEAGEYRGRVYVAMEQVEGGTLREEIDRVDRGGADWRRIVDLFAEAGRGLAAAHAAGMVHRDFKPDNVLIGRDDRVLVGDFGIVSSTELGEWSPGEGGSLLSGRLTRADEVVGTPDYMAPEQHAGKEDARADQFSFCVALYEALYGQLPFAGETRAAYVAAIQRGEVRPPPPHRRIPGWLRAIVERGLSADPARRFASMEDLLAELGAEPQHERRLGGRERMVLIGGVGAAITAWAASAVGFGVELSYQLHYITDVGFLGLVIALGWFGRHSIARSEFNRRAFLFIAAIAVSLIVLVAGAQLAAIPAHTTGALHMVVIGTASLVAVGLFGPRILAMTAAYLAGFLLATARPELLLPTLLCAHAVAGATTLALFRARLGAPA